MIQFSQRATHNATVSTFVTLPIEKRVKSRLRVTLADGREAGIFMQRGEMLQHGDKLLSDDGEAIEIVAAEEKISIVYCHDALSFARACYHLGNRHVPVEITDANAVEQSVTGVVSYLHDHVLDDMLRGIGLSVETTMAPFNPEPGAYGGGHAHHHEH